MITSTGVPDTTYGILSDPGKFVSFKGYLHTRFQIVHHSQDGPVKYQQMVKCAPRPNHASSSRPKTRLTTQTLTRKAMVCSSLQATLQQFTWIPLPILRLGANRLPNYTRPYLDHWTG